MADGVGWKELFPQADPSGTVPGQRPCKEHVARVELSEHQDSWVDVLAAWNV